MEMDTVGGREEGGSGGYEGKSWALQMEMDTVRGERVGEKELAWRR